VIYLACSSNIFFLSFLAFQRLSPHNNRINSKVTKIENSVKCLVSRIELDVSRPRESDGTYNQLTKTFQGLENTEKLKILWFLGQCESFEIARVQKLMNTPDNRHHKLCQLKCRKNRTHSRGIGQIGWIGDLCNGEDWWTFHRKINRNCANLKVKQIRTQGSKTKNAHNATNYVNLNKKRQRVPNAIAILFLEEWS